jgi:hypothetical protein
MATAYILWDRTNKTVVESSGVPILFPSSAAASTHASGRLTKHVNAGDAAKVYDTLTVTIS